MRAREKTATLVLAGLAAGAVLAAAARSGDGPASADVALARRFDGEVRPLLARYCYECHGRGEREGDVALDRYPDLASIAADRGTWLKVADMLSAGKMPPEGHPQPAEAESRRVREWIAETLRGRDCASGPHDPGRVTLRRLNRTEYDNTVRDLLGVELPLANAFPADDRGYGFDNNADVLTTSPLLLEKYLAAAERALAATIVVDDPHRKQTLRTPGTALEPAQSGPAPPEGEPRRIMTNAEVFVRRALPCEALYVVRVRAFGEQAGPDPVRMAIRVDGGDAKVFDVRVEKGHAKNYEHKLKIAAGERRIGAAFLNDFYKPATAKSPAQDRNLDVEWIEVEGPFDAPPAPLPESHRRIFFCTPGPKLAEADAAKRIIHKFAARAFRRPVADDEIARHLALFRAARARKESFEAAIGLALEAVLVSPHFLFRVERDPPGAAPGATYALGDFELATRLSYFLWASMPDEKLAGLAESGALHDPATLDAEVRRMAADPRARALVDGFAAQWLELRNLADAHPDVVRFPGFDEGLRASMRRETELFFETILKEDRSILELLDADWTFANEDLARLYGIEGVEGPELRRVSLRGTPRGGVIGQASVLTLTSNPTRTSPVKRGKWVLDVLLGSPPAPAPPGVPPLEDDPEAAAARPLRERMARHRTDPACAGCHARMDAIGFAFENFDAVGAWREKDGAFAIDASGELPGGGRFVGPAGLRALLLARKGEFVRAFGARLLCYALGRGIEPEDGCALDEMSTAIERGEYKMQAALAAVARSEPFRTRRAAQAAAKKGKS